MRHPKCGASWEGLALEQVLRLAPRAETHKWAVHNGAELDLPMVHRCWRIGVPMQPNASPYQWRQIIGNFLCAQQWCIQYPSVL